MTALLENRIADFVEPERKPAPTPADLSRVWSGAVFAAIAALQAQLSDENPAVVREVANSILDLEKTRLRHGREVAGVESVPLAPRVANSDPLAERVEHQDPLAPRVEHPPDPEAEAALARVEAYLTAVERGDINVPDDLDDDDIDEDELAAIPLPEPPPTLAELFRARVGARGMARAAPEGGPYEGPEAPAGGRCHAGDPPV